MKIVRLTQEHVFKPFDCGEADLNDFLLIDSNKITGTDTVLKTKL